jgi:hypothetical protein
MPQLAVVNALSLDDLSSTAISFATSGAQVILTPSAGYVVRVYRLLLVSAGAVAVTIQDGSTALTGPMSLATGVPLLIDFTSKPIFRFATSFTINSGAAVQVSGFAHYQ